MEAYYAVCVSAGIDRHTLRTELTPGTAAVYYRMGLRHVLTENAVMGLAGFDARELMPISPYLSPPGEMTLGENCNGEAIGDCLKIFGCDEKTLERIACRTCPN